MSYNILHGAGIDPQYDEISGAQGFPGNRVSKILGVMRAVDPDILGIQEALSWERDTPPFAEQFADSAKGGISLVLVNGLRTCRQQVRNSGHRNHHADIQKSRFRI